MRVAAVAAAVLALGASMAAAAIVVLGQPAPKPLRDHLHAVIVGAFGNHPGLQTQTARVLAEAPDATLYGIADKKGNYCLELLGARRGLVYGQGCSAGNGQGTQGGKLDTPVISLVTHGTVPPVVHFGRLPTGTVAARALYADGSSQPIPIGLNNFFLFEASTQHERIARSQPLLIQLTTRTGGTLSYQLLPPQPITSTGNHYNEISGKVLVQSADKVQVTIQDSNPAIRRPKIEYAPIAANGDFHWSGRHLKPTQQPLLLVVDNHKLPLTDPIQTLTQPRWEHLVALAHS
jgi:hypothetical protein